MTDGRVVAVTGATGFLGRHLVAALAHAGASVRLLARRDPDHLLWQGLALEIVRGSLDDAGALERLVAGADAIIHAAGLIKARDSAAFCATNRDGTAAVAAAARRHAPTARFVAISSLAARVPHLSDYAASKRAGEDAAIAAYGDAPDCLTILRPPAIYGPWDRETLAIFQAARRPIVPLLGQGRIAFMHVTDVAGAIARVALGSGPAGCYALSDGNPAGYRMREIMDEAARAQGRRPRYLPVPAPLLLAAGSTSAWWGRLRGQTPIFTPGKAREILHPDWSVTPDEALPADIHRPAIGLADGFRATVAWYREAGWLA